MSYTNYNKEKEKKKKIKKEISEVYQTPIIILFVPL
jgi:type II secretory pathway component PulF